MGSSQSFTENLEWRRAVKEFGTGPVNTDVVVKAMVNAPSSFGIQGLDGMLRYGASPRATIALTIAARAKAFLDGRGYVTPQDVKDVAPAVMRHRLGLSYEAEALEKTGEDVVRTLLEHVPVP